MTGFSKMAAASQSVIVKSFAIILYEDIQRVDVMRKAHSDVCGFGIFQRIIHALLYDAVQVGFNGAFQAVDKPGFILKLHFALVTELISSQNFLMAGTNPKSSRLLGVRLKETLRTS